MADNMPVWQFPLSPNFPFVTMADESVKKIDQQTSGLVLSLEQLRNFASVLHEEMIDGLSKVNHDKSSLKMIPTNVREVPDGTEQGQFVVLDLGGRNFRISAITVNGNRVDGKSDVYDVFKDIMMGTGHYLFDHIAECLAHFVKKNHLSGKKLSIGFVFSFPVQYSGFDCCHVVKWCKGFKCAGVVGKDVVQLFRESILRRDDVQVDSIVVLNDTTGAFLSCVQKNKDCMIGLIIGTGVNSCYMERLENVEMREKPDNDGPKNMVIDLEMGGLGDNSCLQFIRTNFDEKVDRNSQCIGQNLFEKMVSGMYMGEVVRYIIVHCISKGWLLNGHLSEKFMIPYSFKFKYIPLVQMDLKPKYIDIRSVFDKMGASNATTEDCQKLQFICSRVLVRSANLVAACMACILNKLKRPYTVIGVSGHVYRYHEQYRELLIEKTKLLVPTGYAFDYNLAPGGCSQGAALLAAMAARKRKQGEQQNE